MIKTLQTGLFSLKIVCSWEELQDDILFQTNWPRLRWLIWMLFLDAITLVRVNYDLESLCCVICLHRRFFKSCCHARNKRFIPAIHRSPPYVVTQWLVSIIGLRILYCRLDLSLTKLLPNSLNPRVAPVAISNFTSAATGWQVVSNTSYYKHTRWLRADMAYKHCGTVSEGFCCLLYHQLWWLASTLCQQWRQWACVCVYMCVYVCVCVEAVCRSQAQPVFI